MNSIIIQFIWIARPIHIQLLFKCDILNLNVYLEICLTTKIYCKLLIVRKYIASQSFNSVKLKFYVIFIYV